ncbi:hypothetical protein EMIHUDRAFT_211257 [Emiliania huxleyi CCMP1516]|uniref:N-acetyltransferase domain-containing protein n=2 Tax=Emiliania huxleyi TaxID=2903 RepID=A0A0D3IWQ0_EMIH1|nr:hypothetical protein EMIHUDRAFT_211257 [Emiliania huxleyi CCMP1516]EOD15685.1 hypothetical protein EMIHUDRAFT_211257 [Emiliania huxleyi CCMP1516]|eukprot:XP_005768114.1 hypothetical protein EMIHUDRAFT_211257 [Emiliania huxleyi CCMP1516]
MSFSLTGVDDEATQRCFAHIHDRVRATLVRGEPVTVAGGRPVRRTLKLLRALARGHWIVGEEYVAACARNRGVAVDPAPFEEGMLPHVPGAQLSRLSGGGRALAGLTVTLRGATVMPHADLCSLCCEAGARVQYGRPISDAGAVEGPFGASFSTSRRAALAELRNAGASPKPPPPSQAKPLSPIKRTTRARAAATAPRLSSRAHALRLYRRRLPECNVDLPPDVPCSPAHPGLSPQRKRRGADFLHLLVHGHGARTAVARLEGKESIVGALTLIPHAAASFCEARGASLHAGRGIGAALLGAAEAWLAEQLGVRTVVVLAGHDTVGFWRRRGYAEAAPPSGAPLARRGRKGRRGDEGARPALLPEQWSLVRDPFGSSQPMVKQL